VAINNLRQIKSSPRPEVCFDQEERLLRRRATARRVVTPESAREWLIARHGETIACHNLDAFLRFLFAFEDDKELNDNQFTQIPR